MGRYALGSTIYVPLEVIACYWVDCALADSVYVFILQLRDVKKNEKRQNAGFIILWKMLKNDYFSKTMNPS